MNKNIYAAILWMAVSGLAGATTIYVATNGVDDAVAGRGQSWASPYLTISNAVKKATAVNDLVLVSNGEYLLTAQITVSSQIKVQGWNNGVVDSTNTVMNGSGATRCFNISHTGAVVDGFTIYNGNGSGGDGGGVNMTAGTLRNCIVASNSAPNNGGGVRFTGAGAGLMDNCLMEYNVASNGGGIFFYPSGGGALLVTNCVIRNNRAVSSIAGTTLGGGGVWTRGFGSTVILANCSFYGNNSSNNGGGILTRDYCIARNCVISNNFAAGSGGGALCYSGGLLTNCVIVTNAGNGSGGGIYTAYGSTIRNCVIARNRSLTTAGNCGGGGVYTTSGTIENNIIENSIIEENSASNEAGGVFFGGGAVRNCLIRNNTANAGGAMRVFGACDISSCTIVSNYSVGDGGGLLNNSQDIYGMLARVENCIIYFNRSAGAVSNLYNSGTLSSYTNNCFAPALAAGAIADKSTGNITADPQFVGRDSGDHHALPTIS